MLSKEQHAEFLANAKRELDAGVDVDVLIESMKTNGFTPVDCIRAIIDLVGCSLAEATETIASSPAWRELHRRARGGTAL
ncbi:hypothetical protein [Nonomuraea zeae]|uniref:Uncharacterized protein n=1 Tax=Nonomuraea zeae TaxID=1642303 RepID=A0A5S4GSY7_9ACTN|nr:hypothetical protein [Nonomuraea zeae]TMR35604.1 hypothetical protein ETD85_13495 [Nonomuraea zeae]